MNVECAKWHRRQRSLGIERCANRKHNLQLQRPIRDTGETPILKEEVEKAMRMLKTGKSPGIDNIPGEILNQVSSMPKLSK